MYPDRPDNSKQKVVAALVVIALVLLVTAGVKAEKRNGTAAASGSSTSAAVTGGTTASTGTSQSSNSSSSNYKDGTYSASSTYFVPNGEEGIKVTLTVKNGVVADSSVQNSETNPESASYQEYFTSTYKKYVVGKSLNDLQLSFIAGASDTTNGFNEAVSRIQQQAQA